MTNSNTSNDSRENAPLMSAYAGDMDFTVPFLKSFGSALYANSHGDTLLHAAAEGWQYRMVEFLIIYGSDPNAQNNVGNTPLHTLTQSREIPLGGTFIKDSNPYDARTQAFRTLLLRKAHREVRNSQGGTALHYAAWEGDLLAVTELTLGEASGTIDNLTTKGATALALAIMNNHVECARRLLQCGASVVFELPTGRSLVDVMRSSDNPEMRSLANTCVQR